MFETANVDLLFATPLVRYTVKDHKKLSKALLKTGHAMRKKSEGVTKSNRGGWHSEGNLFMEDYDSCRELRTIAGNAVLDATRSLQGKTDLGTLNMRLNAWMNINYAGAFNAPHTHPGAHWSGVYYVKQPAVEEGNSGMIEFVAPRTDVPNWRIFGAEAFRLKRRLRPKEGEIILFPSYLVHWVYPNETDEERVTIAFNATFNKKKKKA